MSETLSDQDIDALVSCFLLLAVWCFRQKRGGAVQSQGFLGGGGICDFVPPLEDFVPPLEDFVPPLRILWPPLEDFVPP